ncbi:MAG: diaminopimelate dehydrogenase [Brockia lithotrophica]|nr:diaminopimelate dehydrogenase [Brockia lithotrophica]MBT9253484.1 diaminopimelate dehydrogenase [Brockia lithotrophica]
MSRIRVAVVGYGNVGAYVLQAVRTAPDMELVALVRRTADRPPELPADVPVVREPHPDLPADVAILAVPSRLVPETAERYLARGVRTADSFDIHEEIPDVRARLERVARKSGAVAVLAAGWDPGTDSVIRVLFEAMAPAGTTFTNFGPGMSMGHSTAARAIPGVRDAVSLTLPLGFGKHRRLVYVSLAPDGDPDAVRRAILEDPYFAHDPTDVVFVDDVSPFRDMGHGVQLERKGVSAGAHNQRFSLAMSVHNPALTAQILVAAARAAVRQAPGAYTLPEIPPIDLLPGDRPSIIRRLV